MGQTILLLGGKPIGSVEIAKYAHSCGDKVIVTDYLPVEESPAKAIADEHWDVSTADVAELAIHARRAGVTGVVSGVHEFNIERSIDLVESLGLPQLFSRKQWNLFENKVYFKHLCIEYGIDVAKEYPLDSDPASLPYPVAVKPLDGSGSRGFSKVEAWDELLPAIDSAKHFSQSEKALIEDYIDGDSVIIHYTLADGRAYFCGIADKHSKKVGVDGAPIMALQIAPSIHQSEYLSTVDDRARAMLESTGVSSSPVWIEAFYCRGKFIFNEAGLRFGGSMTNNMVKHLVGVDQMEVLYRAATGRSLSVPLSPSDRGLYYAVFPIHVGSGVIESIDGVDGVERDPNHVATVWVHHAGDQISSWGSAQQVLAYLHFAASDVKSLVKSMANALTCISVKDSTGGGNMLFSLFDPFDEDAFPHFLKVWIKDGE